MADYASTVTLDFPWAKKIGSALYILSGTAVAAQAGTEVVNDVAVGEINFVAYGYK